ncbi:MAG: hypothetical protein A2068_03140 [Ignavibacteria bacterium GWB2_35_6b]|nr:MAG: hypothetical protein A2068_03140 [Ignavibacteria bacterium GWB2_35_6b]
MIKQFSDISISLNIFFVALTAAICISFLSFKLKLLTKSGAIAALILGATIFTFGQLKWSLPLISFFLFSSIISKVGNKNKTNFVSIFEKKSQRDYGQVMANGAIGGVLVIVNLFFENEVLYLTYLGSLAAVCADTWATEIGTMKEALTYNILNFKKAEQGISGGVSFIGTMGALAGTILISCSAVFWIHLNLIYYFCLIIFAGLLGSFIDSILGAALQSQNKCGVCGKIIERKYHCGVPSSHYKGIKWINNDTVNFFAGLTGSLAVYFINVIIN